MSKVSMGALRKWFASSKGFIPGAARLNQQCYNPPQLCAASKPVLAWLREMCCIEFSQTPPSHLFPRHSSGGQKLNPSVANVPEPP
jgi:hypothetical protein